jgi:hypothetical protein
MSILKSIFKPFIRGINDATSAVNEENTDKAAFKTALASASGLDGVLTAVTAEKKSRKEKAERKQLEDQILSL